MRTYDLSSCPCLAYPFEVTEIIPFPLPREVNRVKRRGTIDRRINRPESLIPYLVPGYEYTCTCTYLAAVPGQVVVQQVAELGSYLVGWVLLPVLIITEYSVHNTGPGREGER